MMPFLLDSAPSSFAEGLGRLLAKAFGLEDLRSVEAVEPALAAPWAQSSPGWVFFGAVALTAAAGLFYLRFQSRGRKKTRIALAVVRAILLSTLFLILAEPVLTLKYVANPRPYLWLLFDGTESMSIADEEAPLRAAEGKASTAAAAPAAATTPTEAPAPGEGARATRTDLLEDFLKQDRGAFLRRLSETFRLRCFAFDRPNGVQALEAGDLSHADADPAEEAARLAEELTTDGQVTALGAAFEDLARRQVSGNLAGVIVFSDFDQNAGPSAVDEAKKLGVPVHTVGIGPISARDLGVDLQAPLLLKKAERAVFGVTIRQTGLLGETVRLRLSASALGGPEAGGDREPFLISERAIELDESVQTVEIPYTPDRTGRFLLAAQVEPLAGEVIDQNNKAEREVNIRDDFLRLMFVEYEPTWEWRFIKEVFHRDRLVGERGFRTFLRSADPKVRQENPLFLSTLTPPRSEFFSLDVIFLGDMQAGALSSRFCDLLEEFVGRFGGGLVVISGPRFGPAGLAKTRIAEMLPVVVDPDGRPRDDREFRLRLTPEAAGIDFMQLGESPQENSRAWDALGRLPWYQPVERLHPLATVIAEHPTDLCLDGKTPQPIIALRPYGKGEVIYLGFNETWRLRRKFGEMYYRQFWGQMIHRLGLSHVLGSQKRFVVRTDRRQYQVDEKAILTVEAYDANFEPLSPKSLPEGRLSGEVSFPGRKADGSPHLEPIALGELRDGIFEASIPLDAGGEHRVKVTDPVTGEASEVRFQVTSISVERRSAVRNAALASEIAAATGGIDVDLARARGILANLDAPARTETSVKVFALWNTWFCFGLVIVLLFSEWLARKFVNLP